jgi:hypothetical protein
MVWERSGRAFHATVEAPSGSVLFHLIVEELPDGAWDWAVWHPGGPSSPGQHGVATSVQEAMRAAKEAAT